MNGHFKMFNYMMKHAGEPLTADIIKGMHKNLKEGVFEDMANGYAVGDWKKRANLVGDITTALPQEVPAKIEALLAEYTSKRKLSCEILQNSMQFLKISIHSRTEMAASDV